ncbi:hypothetical protein AR1Y2_0422 [Anaerostipes rhamnosivorans]|uniref:Uncharacterized protein n=1 Tax=Anaerostipes rhamnosivorans TaxID=1229621 RepID=A0A4P8I911_9FIRM|nr:hypothetical protein AR1Y2_0422 [Anaerostipes rhamnosivorans]
MIKRISLVKHPGKIWVLFLFSHKIVRSHKNNVSGDGISIM